MGKEILKVIDKVSQCVLVTKAFNILYVNPKGLELFACDLVRLKEHKITDFIHSDDLSLFNQRQSYLLAGNDLEMRFGDFKESYRWVRFSVEKIDWDGELVDMYFLSDISKRKETEETLQRINAEAEKLESLESSFLANMSHEIRTPLNAIIGFSQLLPHDDISDQIKKDYYRLIEENSHQLLDLVDDIMDWSEIQTGQIKINKSKFAVNGFFAELQPKFEDKILQSKSKEDIKLSFKTPVRSDDVSIVTDRIRLKQIFYNLMNNALKMTIKGQVVIGYRVLDRFSLEFYVKDTGVGIQKEKQEQVFKHNYNINSLSKSKQKGSSLALAITKSLVDILDGDISLISEYGKGSEFSFRLPYKAEQNDAPKKVKNIPAYLDWSEKCILIVEDEVSNYLFIKEALRRTKVKLFWVENGADAIAWLEKKNSVDLILMDLHMPIMDGYEAKVRISEMGVHVPVIAQTAFAMAEEKKKIADLGFSSYIAKPIQLNSLISLISEYL